MTSVPPQETHAFGFLPYVKPPGMTSRELVNRVQRRLRREFNDSRLKVGHTGTLDPLADGLVVIAVGAAARLTPWLLQHSKSYVARFELGISSTSGDLEESVTPLNNAPQPCHGDIQSACERLRGWIEQTPPGHSAIWVDGERAHQRIRRGEQVEMPKRRVWIESIDILQYDYPHLDVDVRCGSGTYLRSLGMDIAAFCQTVAVMTKLTRTEVGPFKISSAVADVPPNDPPPSNREQLAEGLSPMGKIGELRAAIEAPIVGLRHLPYLTLDNEVVQRVRHGRSVTGQPMMPANLPIESPPSDPLQECIAVDSRGDLVAVLRTKRGDWAPFRVFAETR